MTNKNINIKVNRLIAITELENKLVAAKAAEEVYEKEAQAYNEAFAQWQSDIKNELIKGNFEWAKETYGSPIDTYGHSGGTGTIRAYMKLNNMPAEPKKPSSNGARITASSKDIERMIRLLKMSTDESVSTKVYDSLGEML
jgi:hypothetical protein